MPCAGGVVRVYNSGILAGWLYNLYSGLLQDIGSEESGRKLDRINIILDECKIQDNMQAPSAAVAI